MEHSRRAAAAYIGLVTLFAGILCRLYVLTLGGDALALAAHNQSAFLLEVDSTRGIIYDRALKPLVGCERESVAAVQPSPEAFTAMAEAAREEGIDFDPKAHATKPFLINLEDAQVYSVGVEMFDRIKRYSENQLAPHIIGYLNPEKTDGAAGIELSYNDLLRQYEGSLKLRYTLNATGQTMLSQPPTVRQDNYRDTGGVVLTLDADIQRVVQDAMKEVEKGAAVVMDLQNGNLIASCSMPAYDPNRLADSLKDPDSPFVNRAFSQYNVGSTFKLVTAAAALETGYGRYNPYDCEGYTKVDGHIFYCHWRNGHGEIDLNKAIEVSCNPFFIHMGQAAGGKRVAAMAREIGFTRAAQFSDEIATQAGTLPTDKQLDSPTETANLSFGQGRLTATPVQIAQMVSAVANGGYAVTPRLVEGFTDNGKTVYERTISYTPSRVFSKRTSDILRETMVNNVENGSGKLAKPVYADAGGKTASAQTGVYRTPGDPDSEIVHAWFAGYYPARQPKYAIVVLVEGGGSGSDAAAPIFRKIADGIYLSEL